MSRYLIGAFLLLGIVALHVRFTGSAAPDAPLPADEVAYESTFVNASPIPYPETEPEAVYAVVTAYSSRVGETDSTPFTTALGTKVRPGVVAANWLPLGAKIKIPELFGDRIFTVEDRMHSRNRDKVDVWFESTEEALRFGVRKARIEIL